MMHNLFHFLFPFTKPSLIITMKEFARLFYNGSAWMSCRGSYIAKRICIDGGMCEICKENLGYIVHHKIEITPQNINDPNITLNHDNLQYVCFECHNRIHGVGVDKSRVEFDANGNVIEKKII